MTSTHTLKVEDLKSEILQKIEDKSKNLLDKLEELAIQEQKISNHKKYLDDLEETYVKHIKKISIIPMVVPDNLILGLLYSLAVHTHEVASKEYANGYNQLKSDIFIDLNNGLTLDSNNSTENLFKRYFPSIFLDEHQEELILRDVCLDKKQIATYNAQFNYKPKEGQKYREPVVVETSKKKGKK